MVLKNSLVNIVWYWENRGTTVTPKGHALEDSHLNYGPFAECIMYSGIAIYRFDIDRFSACTVRNFWSRIKFHINNVIYFRIHRSLNYRFSALIICKSRSRRGIFRMDRLKKKKFEAKYLLMALPSLWTIHLATQ